MTTCTSKIPMLQLNLYSTFASALLLATAASLAGCELQTSAVDITAYGEPFIEDGIAADDMDDGWAVTFDTFEVGVKEVHLGDTSVNVDATVDLTASSDGAGHVLQTEMLPVGSYTNSGFTLGPLQVSGSATLGDDTVSFSWTFDDEVTYDNCETTTEVLAGVDGAQFEITVHADHLFYDSVVADEPQLLFQALADADANDDGNVTPDELAATDIGAYDPGSEDGVDDLWAFLTKQSASVGHVDGEGHCSPASE